MIGRLIFAFFIVLPVLLGLGGVVAFFLGNLWVAGGAGVGLMIVGGAGIYAAMTTPIQLQPIPLITFVVGVVMTLLAAGGLLL